MARAQCNSLYYSIHSRKTTNGALYNEVLNIGIMMCNNICSAVCDNMYNIKKKTTLF